MNTFEHCAGCLFYRVWIKERCTHPNADQCIDGSKYVGKCGSCQHINLGRTDEPCRSCDDFNSGWEARS